MNYKNYEDAIEYLNEQEKTSIDYCKIGSGSKTSEQLKTINR